MTDYGRAVEFGFFPAPLAAEYDEIVEQALIADSAGLDFFGIQDHPYQRRFLDTFSLITDLAARTERLRFFPDVASLPMHNPAVMAKMAASIDLMSGGRFELGLGAGAFWDAIEGMGGQRRTPGDAVDALAEAIRIVRLMWSGERGLRFEGRHYAIKGIHSGPVPAHDISIWIGASRPRMLSLIGRLADGWVPSSGSALPRSLTEGHERIDEAALRAGRKPGDIRRIFNVNGAITDGRRGDYLEGPVAYWTDELTRLTLELGMDTFVFWPSADATDQLRRYVDEVVPGVRSEVAARRAA